MDPERSGLPASARPARFAVRYSLFAIVALLAIAAVSPFDPHVHALYSTGTLPAIPKPVFYLLNAFGIAGLWLVVAAAYLIIDGIRARFQSAERTLVRAAAIIVPVVIAGLAGEALKVVVRRERPLAHGEYVFRDWGPGWDSTSGLGMPSTHAAVGFAAAAALGRLHRRGRYAWFGIALGCVYTRLQPNESGEVAHFFSDVVAGAALGWLTERLVNRELIGGRLYANSNRAQATAPERPPLSWMSWPATVALTLAVLAVRIVYLRFWCAYELFGDEAHYWDWTRHLDWCYDIKGPGLAYLIAASTAAFGIGEWTVRLPMAVCSAVATLAIARLATRAAQGDARVGFLAAAMFTLAPAYQGNAQITTPDGPLIACWVLACWALLSLAQKLERGEIARNAWLLAALTLGLGVLFKQSMMLIVFGLPVYAWLRRRQIIWRRAVLGDALLAMLLFALLISPIFIWNAQHNWQTFRHALGHLGAPGGDQPQAIAGTQSWSPEWTLGMIGMQLGAFGPPLVALMVLAIIDAVRRRREDPARWSAQLLMLALAAPGLVIYTAVTIWKKAEGNWPFPVFASLVVLAAMHLVPRLAAHRRALAEWRALPQRPRPWLGRLRRRPETPVTALWDWTIIYGVAGWLLLSFANVLATTSVVGKHVDVARFHGARKRGAVIGACAKAVELRSGRPPFLMTGHYMVTALTAFYVPGRPAVLCVQQRFGHRPSSYDFWPRTDPNNPALRGRDVILVGKTAALWESVVDAERIETLDPGHGVYIGWGYRGLKSSSAP